jgi:DNA-binding MarR family transcriptional regulator
MRLEDEIKQSRFKSSQEHAAINILFSANWINRNLHRFHTAHGISSQQFNVLRILRGLNPKPASISLLNERMLDRMSNVSRLVDKLTDKKYAKRVPCEQDRRQVDVFITDKGLDLVNKISEEVDNALLQHVNLTDEEAAQLSTLLDKMRDPR